ncbi:hypothetical protein [Nocardia concava]|uniref:hypothetical protein n=1 Tax=Nocardia concava TaxID=257281 RepID=UPI000594AE4E|nr:hypothetical protein [Nocardia concava]
MLLVGLGRMLLLPLDCAGDRMDPGQVCTTTEKGHTVTRSFEQQRSLRQTTDGFLIVGGLVVGAGSAVLLIRRRSSGS